MTWLIFLIFLGYHAYVTYFSPPPATIDQPFVMSALLVLSITVIVPFFISYMLTRATQLSGRAPAIMLGFIASLSLSMLGYWIVWRYFGGVADVRMPVQEVLKLGLIPGLIMGAILAGDSLLRGRSHA